MKPGQGHTDQRQDSEPADWGWKASFLKFPKHKASVFLSHLHHTCQESSLQEFYS